jgi:hypothetical protein
MECARCRVTQTCSPETAVMRRKPQPVLRWNEESTYLSLHCGRLDGFLGGVVFDRTRVQAGEGDSGTREGRSRERERRLRQRWSVRGRRSRDRGSLTGCGGCGGTLCCGSKRTQHSSRVSPGTDRLASVNMLAHSMPGASNATQLHFATPKTASFYRLSSFFTSCIPILGHRHFHLAIGYLRGRTQNSALKWSDQSEALHYFH